MKQDGSMDHSYLSGEEKTGVVVSNSIGYVRTMLSNLEEGLVSVPLRSRDDRERTDRLPVVGIVEPQMESGWMDTPFDSRGGKELAMVSFTSGTEGVPKAVFLSKENLHDVVMRVSEAMEITDEIREYIGVPVYHSFGYGRCRIVLNAGGKCFLPDQAFDLLEIRRMLQESKINAISAVPSLWRVFLNELDLFGPELEEVRWIEIGSQFMSKNEKIALRTAMPNAKIVQHYGLTEASRSTLLRIHSEPPEKLNSVGCAEGDVNVRMSRRGRIEIKGPNVAIGVDDGQSFRPSGGRRWLETSDLGRLEDGYLYFEGRADDVINCAGIKLSPDVMESHVRAAVETNGDFGILRRNDPMRGEAILLALHPDAAEDEDAIVDAISAYTEDLGTNLRSAIRVVYVDELPRTSTGKLQRAKLQKILDTRQDNAADSPAIKRNLPKDQNEFSGTLRTLLSIEVSDFTKSFHELGGDSLMHMQLALAIERALGNLPPDWEAMPLADLIGQVTSAGELRDMVATGAGTPPLPDGSANMNPPDLSFRELVREDYLTNDASVFHQGFLMLLVHRFGNLRMDIKTRLLRAPCTLIYRFLNKLTQFFFGMKLDYTVKVGRRVKLEHFGGMILGARAIGNDVVIRQNTTFGIRSTDDLCAKPTIGNFVDIGAGAVIVGNVTIGDNSIIGANSVVYTNVPPNSVVVGVPGKIIGRNPRQNPSPLRKD